MSEIPEIVADGESLHRRIRPEFVKPDGSVSSQAFTDPEMSVDRAAYWTLDLTLRGYEGMGVASLLASWARELNQEVVGAPELLNPAHALVKGKKSKSVAKALARLANWAARIDREGNSLPNEPGS